jgi:UDP-GlcNAc:undecaprenyl-phosphate GlcNAc-1-phosphate transferase
VLAAALCVLVTPAARALARRLGASDHGDDGRAVPRLGGLAVLLASLGALGGAHLVGDPSVERLAATDASLAWLAAGIALITVAGIYDDLHGLAAWTKLALQTLAALLVFGGGHGIAGTTNPVNLIDGLDGLAAGVGAIASATLLVIALTQGRVETVPVWAALGGALAGFLVYNFPPASIFLGDTGSLLLGFAVAVLAMQSVAKGPAALVVLAPVVALGLPIADVVLAVVRRARAAGPRGVFRRDREHVHHRLVGAGLSARDAVLVLYAVSAGAGALAVAAVLLHGVADGMLLAITIVAVWVGVRFVRMVVTRSR